MCRLEGSLRWAAGKAFLEKVEFQLSFEGKAVHITMEMRTIPEMTGRAKGQRAEKLQEVLLG